MDMEANLPVPPATPSRNLVRPILNQDTSSSSSSSSSPSDFLRHVQAAFKRHHPLGTMQSSSIGPRRTLVPQHEASRSSGSNVVSPVDVSITPPTLSGTITKTFDVHKEQPKPDIGCKEINPISLSLVESHHVDVQRKVQFSTGNNAGSQGADDRMATGMENLTSHMYSLALTDMEWDASNPVEASTVVNHDQKFHNAESDISSKSDGGVSSLLAKRTTTVQDQLFRKFLNQPATQSSVVGS